jgi:GT2 family glycosyltransferase
MKILICIVLYNQKIEESNAFRNLSMQDTKADCFFYLFDNSPCKSTVFPAMTNVYYTHNPNNPGLSVAFNHAAKYALENGFEWLLLSDQDTNFSMDFIQKMQMATIEYPSVSLFAPIVKLSNNTLFSPCKFRNMVSKPLQTVSHGINSLRNTMPINSGLLIKTSLFFEAGGYDENLRVDFCDYAFLNKVKKIEDKYVVVDSIAVQSFSNEEVDKEKLLSRFRIYISDVTNYPCNTYRDRIGLFYSVFKHTMALSMRTKCIVFFKLFIKKYLFV